MLPNGQVALQAAAAPVAAQPAQPTATPAGQVVQVQVPVMQANGQTVLQVRSL